MLILVVFCQIADIRGIGIWKRDTWVESLAAYPSQIIHIIKFSAITQLAVRYLNLVLFFKIKIFLVDISYSLFLSLVYLYFLLIMA